MNNKRAIFIGVLISVFIIPQIALAAWWNPLSWFNNWSFFKKEKDTVALEIRIKELEQKLEEKDNESPNLDFSALTKKEEKTEGNDERLNITEPKNDSSTKSQKVEAEENWNDSLSLTIDKHLEWYTLARNYISTLISSVDSRINDIDSLITKAVTAQNYSNNSDEIEIYALFIDLYKADKNLIVAYKNQIKTSLDGFDLVISELNKKKVGLPNQFINRQQAIFELNDFSGLLDYMGKTFDKTKVFYNEFKNESDRQDGIYTEYWNQINTALNKSNYVPTPVYAPVLKSPSRINCLISDYGHVGTINCYSY